MKAAKGIKKNSNKKKRYSMRHEDDKNTLFNNNQINK